MVKLFVKLDESWLITECSLAKYSTKEEEPADSIEVTEEQLQKIRDKYETTVKDWKIVKQVAGAEYEAIQAKEAEQASEEPTPTPES